MFQKGSQADAQHDEDKQNLELRKTALVEALYQRCILLNRQASRGDQEGLEEKLIAATKELKKFLDSKTDIRFAEVQHQINLRQKNFGKTLKYANQIFEDKPGLQKYHDIIDAARNLGWMHVVNSMTEKIPVLFPAKYDLF